MSQTPDAQPDEDLKSVEETPLEETPAAAGGKDSGEPKQGTGSTDSH
ncbi:hypothetical protein [Mobilicoccus pelagius]|uniref:Uncharacterized protein n=1 Tax=Mobilicoccus pelagius NBRC 104925 TaxID=1089455 RepID=H5USZ5_9MICO|nr:hypothetical protein [Mobilicoccus pelagius]GAB48853.1 hypothetical protein MOPEL_083_00580 [Mobilicoccus pelagius NBRC 104925]